MVQSEEHTKHLALLGQKMDTLIKEVSSLRRVVVGNGDKESLINQVHELKMTGAIACADRKRMAKRLDEICAVQDEQGIFIAALRNRVIGIVAVLSLAAGAGAGFIAAARLLTAAVP